ncbi:hypothetical protein DMUE_1392 [Dictyocoela muelleri]|nr:hypothetical protein DMUE_1392 [Dictyocoela muelleri]
MRDVVNIHEEKLDKVDDKNKICQLHGHCKHTTKECRVINKQQDKNNNHKEFNKPKNLIMNPENIKPKILTMNMRLESTTYNVIIDTGPTYNYINAEIVKNHKIRALMMS